MLIFPTHSAPPHLPLASKHPSAWMACYIITDSQHQSQAFKVIEGRPSPFDPAKRLFASPAGAARDCLVGPDSLSVTVDPSLRLSYSDYLLPSDPTAFSTPYGLYGSVNPSFSPANLLYGAQNPATAQHAHQQPNQHTPLLPAAAAASPVNSGLLQIPAPPPAGASAMAETGSSTAPSHAAAPPVAPAPPPPPPPQVELETHDTALPAAIAAPPPPPQSSQGDLDAGTQLKQPSKSANGGREVSTGSSSALLVSKTEPVSVATPGTISLSTTGSAHGVGALVDTAATSSTQPGSASPPRKKPRYSPSPSPPNAQDAPISAADDDTSDFPENRSRAPTPLSSSTSGNYARRASSATSEGSHNAQPPLPGSPKQADTSHGTKRRRKSRWDIKDRETQEREEQEEREQAAREKLLTRWAWARPGAQHSTEQSPLASFPPPDRLVDQIYEGDSSLPPILYHSQALRKRLMKVCVYLTRVDLGMGRGALDEGKTREMVRRVDACARYPSPFTHVIVAPAYYASRDAYDLFFVFRNVQDFDDWYGDDRKEHEVQQFYQHIGRVTQQGQEETGQFRSEQRPSGSKKRPRKR
ncbi:hypothetical protein JCM11641_006996 [Rhodosporidiobolus odoratus]